MNDDFDAIEEKSTGGNWIPGALALLALVLGGAALFFALDASRRLSPMSDSLAEESAELPFWKIELVNWKNRSRNWQRRLKL